MRVMHFLVFLAALVVSHAFAANTMYEANLALEQEDYAAALPIYRDFARKGDAEAQRKLAHMYMRALGVPSDEERAACWYRRAAMQGDSKSRSELLGMLGYGMGTPRDARQTYALLEAAVAQAVSESSAAKAREQMAKMVAQGFDPSTATIEPKEVKERCAAQELTKASTRLDASAAHTTIKRNRDGHFYIDGAVNGVPVIFMVDTGATMVSISQQVAAVANITGGRRTQSETANGIMVTRVVTGISVSAGSIGQSNASVSVGLVGTDPRVALLGQSFLSKLDISISGDEMTLKKIGRKSP